MADFWAQPAGRVVHLRDVNPDALALALDPLPADAPAVVTCRPRTGAGLSLVPPLLAELDRVARELFPAWLPGADGLDGPQGARVAAVRALAARQGATTSRFGRFLADLAQRSLSGAADRGQLAAEARAAGLARVVADSFARPYAALLVAVPERLPPVEAQRLVAAGEWLAQQGGFAVWLAGGELSEVDRLPVVRVRLPERVAELARTAEPAGPRSGADGPVTAGTGDPRTAGPAVELRCPPPAGRPAPGSVAEQALEAALAAKPWAAGRAWNRTYRSHPLAEEIRVDLMWERERCAVEIDGPEHRGALHYAADRRRDVLLQLSGFAVLRFTNDQVTQDLGMVLSHIEQLITSRRMEGTDDAR